jgi:hypothetical protein
MSDWNITRRQAGLVIAVGAAGLVTRSALGQPATKPGAAQPATPGTPAPSFLDKVLTRGRENDWNLKVHVHLQAFQDQDSNGMPRTIPIKFETAAVVFPVLTGTASSETHVESASDLKGKLSFNDKPRDWEADLKDGYDAGTRLGRWTMRNMEGRQVDLDIELPMTTWKTVFDEAAASKATWPASGKWGKVSKTCFAPQARVDFGDQRIVNAVKLWTNNKDPKSIPPVQLAKFLAGKVMEGILQSGNGLAFSRTGLLEGVDLQGAARTLELGRGSIHDMACALCAVYRAAGLPARTVIGFDELKKSGDDKFLKKGDSRTSLTSWVEFCLYDEAADKEVWIPVDIARLRRSGARAPALDKPWRFFGTHDELDDVLPFAFQYHPPTTVVAHGSYAFWGWMTTPRTQIAEQFVRFDAQSVPKRPQRKQPSRSK